MSESDFEVVEDFIVDKCSGRAFVVEQGLTMRVIQIGGGQVADLKFLNADNHKEQFSGAHSMMLNTLLGEPQTYIKMHYLFSKPPWERIMMTVTSDTAGMNTFGSHCSKKAVEIAPHLIPGRSCADNFEDCLAEYGLSIEDTEASGVFVAFMPRHVGPNGDIVYAESPAKDGDYIDFKAEMNVLVAFSNCPCGPPVNPPGWEDMRVQILRPTE